MLASFLLLMVEISSILKLIPSSQDCKNSLIFPVNIKKN